MGAVKHIFCTLHSTLPTCEHRKSLNKVRRRKLDIFHSRELHESVIEGGLARSYVEVAAFAFLASEITNTKHQPKIEGP